MLDFFSEVANIKPFGSCTTFFVKGLESLKGYKRRN
jgi:hypothetical protein